MINVVIPTGQAVTYKDTHSKNNICFNFMQTHTSNITLKPLPQQI